MKFFDNSLHFRLLSYKSHQHGKFKSRLHKNKNNKSPCPTAQVSAPTPEQTNSEPSPDKVAMLILKNIFKALVLQLPASSPSNAENEPFKPFFPRETFEEHECNKEVIVSSILRMMRIMFGWGFVFRLLFAVAIPPFQSFLLTEICWCVQVVASTRHHAAQNAPCHGRPLQSLKIIKQINFFLCCWYHPSIFYNSWTQIGLRILVSLSMPLAPAPNPLRLPPMPPTPCHETKFPYNYNNSKMKYFLHRIKLTDIHFCFLSQINHLNVLDSHWKHHW